jgi:hypothetical protein
VPIKYDDYVKAPLAEVEYDSEKIQELQKCSMDIWNFFKYVKIVHPDKGRIIFVPREFQKKIIDTIQTNRYVVTMCSRQVGKTTVIAAYGLWYAIFNDDKTVGIVSNKQTSAIDILSRIRLMYEELPVWLKPGVKEYSKTFIQFDNGSKIVVSATSPDAFRGRTLNILVCDEYAFVRKHIADDFWAANYPTISASTDAKILIISTPNGMFNMFHKLYAGAQKGENTFIPLRFNWRCIPGRDAKWAQEQRENLGETKFMQEEEVEFLGSRRMVIRSDILEMLFIRTIVPIDQDLEGHLKIYERPEKNAQYILGVDVAKGTGENYSTIQVLKVNSLKPIQCKQVAAYRNNNIDVYNFAEVVNRTGLFFNNAYILVENNAEGSTVVNHLWWELENARLINSITNKPGELGIRATKSTKPKAVLLMKKLIEENLLEVTDDETTKELCAFIEDNGKFHGEDYPDDLVSALYWATWIFEMKILDDEATVRRAKSKEEEEEGWGILADVETAPEEDWLWLFDR